MIRAYVGLMGEGKTLSMVNDALERVRQGQRVYSNVPFKNVKTGWFDKNDKLQPIIVGTKDLENLIITQDNALFCIDEANIVFPSYYWKKLNPEYLIRFCQTRKVKVDLFYTSQGFTHTVVRLRELTNEVVRCEHRFFFGQQFFINTGYDPEKFDRDFVTEFQEMRARIWQKRIYWARAKYLFKCFDTYHIIDTSTVMGIERSINLNKEKQLEAEKIKRFSNIPSIMRVKTGMTYQQNVDNSMSIVDNLPIDREKINSL
jgi:hypothetical protein